MYRLNGWDISKNKRKIVFVSKPFLFYYKVFSNKKGLIFKINLLN